MQSDTTPEPNSRPAVFRIPWSHSWTVISLVSLAFGVLLEAALVWGVLFNTPGHTALGAAIGLGIATVVVLGLCVLPFFGVRGIRLVAGPTGMEYHGWGYTVRSPWENITGVRRQNLGGGVDEWFELRQPSLALSWWMRAFLWAQPLILTLAMVRSPETRGVAAASLAREGKRIPVPFWLGPEWRDGPLGAAVRAYAPRLRLEARSDRAGRR